MIRMLAAVVSPSSGSLIIDGVDAVARHFQVKSKLNMISGGERNLYWRLTAVENLRYFGSLYGLSGPLLKERIRTLLAMTGLTEAANTPVERYSKGMKQRLQIARGLINDPAYLFLDEPTLGLDMLIAKEMRGYIAALAEDQDKGILLTTHHISEAEELCDYIYVIDQGRIIAKGSKEELKGLFGYRQSLLLSVAALPAECEAELNRAMLAKETDMTLMADRRQINLLGNSTVWAEAFAILSRHEVQITDIRNKEPDLEEVLVAIIKDFRSAQQMR